MTFPHSVVAIDPSLTIDGGNRFLYDNRWWQSIPTIDHLKEIDNRHQQSESNSSIVHYGIPYRLASLGARLTAI